MTPELGRARRLLTIVSTAVVTALSIAPSTVSAQRGGQRLHRHRGTERPIVQDSVPELALVDTTLDTSAVRERVATDRRRFSFRRVGVAAAYEHGWLCFECEDEKRRLAPVPDTWDNAEPEQLQAWCQAAKRVLKCGPQG